MNKIEVFTDSGEEDIVELIEDSLKILKPVFSPSTFTQKAQLAPDLHVLKSVFLLRNELSF